MPHHDLQIFRELPVQERQSRQRRDKVPVDRRPINKLPVLCRADLLHICRNNLLTRQLPRVGQARHVRVLQKPLEGLLLLLIRHDRNEAGALRERLRERHRTLFAAVGRHLMHDATTTGRLAEDGDPRGIAAEQVDIPLDPFKSETLVVQAGIRGAVLLERWAGQPAKGAETVVEAHVLLERSVSLGQCVLGTQLDLQ